MKKILLFIGLLLCLNNNSFSDNLDSGLVAYFPFNGNTSDESGNGNNLSNYGAVFTENRFNISNTAMLFTGGAYMEKDSPNNFPLGGSPKTISCWMKTSNSGTTMVLAEWGVHFISQRFALMTYVSNSCEFFSGFANDVQGNIVVTDNQWKHIAVTYESGNLRMYVNGIIDKNVNISLLNTLSNKFRLGKSNVDSEPYTGILDDIRIYNRALTDTEILKLYYDTVLLDGPLAYYPFNGNANDLSGNGHNGIVQGASLSHDRFGNPNRSFHFNGYDNNIHINNFPLINNDFTYSVWLKIDGNNWSSDLQSFGILGPGDVHTWDFTYNNVSKLWDLWDRTNSSWYTSYPVSGNTLNWTHVIISYHSGIQYLYVNGQLLNSRVVSLPINFGGGDTLMFGASDFNNGQPLNGNLDDIRIYGRALSHSEILALYNENNSSIGLVAYYPFNGNTNDESGQGNHGTNNGAVLTTDRFDNPNSAYDFNGINNWINVAQSNSLEFSTGDFSVFAWIKSSSLNFERVVSKGECFSTGWQLGCENRIRPSFQSQPHGVIYPQSDNTIYKDGNWHLIGFTRENGNIQIWGDGYRDGNTTSFPHNMTNIIEYMTIGRCRPSGGACNDAFFTGVIDDIRIYNRALNDAEVLSLFDIQTPDSFSDNFNDNNFTSNPTWNLTPGGTGCQAPGLREVINGEFHVYDMDSYGCGHSTMIESGLNIPVNNSTHVKFDVNPVFSDVRNGAGDTHFEYPAIVKLELRDNEDSLKILMLCYNYRGGSSLFTSDLARVAFPFVPQNQWQRNQTFRIKDYFQDVERIEKIMIGADGWNYESYFDNILINSFDKIISIKAIPEGMYSPFTNKLRMKDTLTVYLRNQNSPYNKIDSSKSVFDSVTFVSVHYSNIPDGSYYISAKHKNCIETWSSNSVTINSDTISYDFTVTQSNTYGNNSVQVDNSPVRFGFFSGDVNYDDNVEGYDLSKIENDAVNFLTGYEISDLTGDRFVDGSDYSIADNNAANFVSTINP